MSSPIWTPDALSSELRPYRGTCWRLVEAQHRVSTLKLVDTLEEQAMIEALVEETKPAIPSACRHLDYLLATPFRYDTRYRRGSRFRRSGQTPGVFYAAEETTTAVAEIAFHRLLFFAESPATPWPADAGEYTAFATALASQHAIDLTREPFVRERSNWMHPTDCTPAQEIADAIRVTTAEIIRYQSVRDPQTGVNLAVLACRAFAVPRPIERQTWRIRLSASGVQGICEYPVMRLQFDRSCFAADSRIAALNWQR